jgi:hypothetical protein
MILRDFEYYRAKDLITDILTGSKCLSEKILSNFDSK